MTNTYSVGQDDNGFLLDVLCSDANGPVELVGATAILLYLSTLDGLRPNLEALPCTAEADYAFTNGSFINSGLSGKHCIARHAGLAAETAVAGTYRGRIQVTWGTGEVRSFPTTDSYFEFVVTQRP